jgi:trans-aconitate methyltransferase
VNEADKKEIIERYEKRLGEFGHDVRTLASGTDEKQHTRYRALLDIGIRSGDSILDLGCGFGDFNIFLLDEGIEVNYTGYDIVPGLIDMARTMQPSAHFEVRDIQDNPPGEQFDWVVSSQAFNNRLKYEDNFELVKDVVSIAFRSCRNGLAIDMMGDYVDFIEDRLYYFNPEKAFSFAKSITSRVTLRHDYLPHEFCIYVFKDTLFG